MINAEVLRKMYVLSNDGNTASFKLKYCGFQVLKSIGQIVNRVQVVFFRYKKIDNKFSTF